MQLYDAYNLFLSPILTLMTYNDVTRLMEVLKDMKMVVIEPFSKTMANPKM